MKPFLKSVLVLIGVAFLAPHPILDAQNAHSTRPVVDLRTAESSPVLLRGGNVVSEPGQSPRSADVLIEGNVITQVSPTIDPPAGAEIIDVTGKTIYAGLIDAMHDIELPRHGGSDPTAHWNANITPQDRAFTAAQSANADLKKLREQGITAQLLAPQSGIIKGTSCVVLLVDADDPQRLLRDDVFQHATLTVPRGPSRDRYPNSPMGATALVRQSLYDAIWYRDALRAHALHPELARPEPNVALRTLADALESQTMVIDSANERMVLRAADLGDEFSIPLIIRGSGREYRSVAEIKKRRLTFLLPVNFPDAPDTSTAESIRETSLSEWMHWHFAPENPAMMDEAGIKFCLTTDGLDDPGKFLKLVRSAVARGLDPDVALASVTTTPAKILGIEERVGRVREGMLANLVVADGELMAENTKITDTWIAGQRFEVGDEASDDDPLIGSWKFTLSTKKEPLAVTLVVAAKGKRIVGKVAHRCTGRRRQAE